MEGLRRLFFEILGRLKKIPPPLLHALVGWAAGALLVVGLYLIWPTLFPAVRRDPRYYDPGLSRPSLLTTVWILASPTALLGGFIGGRLPREGGRREQILMAAILGAVMAMPCGCGGLWFFTA